MDIFLHFLLFYKKDDFKNSVALAENLEMESEISWCSKVKVVKILLISLPSHSAFLYKI